MNVLRLDKSVFGGISIKRKELTWDDNNVSLIASGDQLMSAAGTMCPRAHPLPL